jgi:hypothetical protein
MSRISEVEVVNLDAARKYLSILADLTIQGSARVDAGDFFAVLLEEDSS